jgi:hypothetical protein
MFRFLSAARSAMRRSLIRFDEGIDRGMRESSTFTALRHHWIDPLERR